MSSVSAWVPRASESAAVETVASVRSDLAAVYNILQKQNLNEGVCNHLTALVPGTTDRFLVVRYGLQWSEVTPDNLVLVDASGKILEGEGPVEATAFEIHRSIHLADPSKYGAVLHTHSPYSTALCCIAGSRGLQMCHQNHLRFYNDWAFDDVYNGLVLENTEGDRLAAAMRGKRVLMHANHGVIVCGRTVAEAFDDLYYLERACMFQVLAMSTGMPLSIIGEDVCAASKKEMDLEKAAAARLHLDALKRELAREGNVAGPPAHLATLVALTLTVVSALGIVALAKR